MAKYLSGFDTVTTVLLSLSILLFAGFLMTRLTRLLKLPYVSAYIIAGVLLGPNLLAVVPSEIVNNMAFLNDLAVAFIAFNVGRFFKRDVIREAGAKIVVITLFENLLSGVVVAAIARFVFGLPTDFSLLLGAIATATSPASTMMIVDQYHARGKFVNTLLQVVALDNVISLFSFSIVTGIMVVTSKGASVSFSSVALPIIYNIAAIVLGFICGIILFKIITPRRSKDNRLILTIALLLGISGLCAIFDISPLLSCMVFGATYINTKKDKDLYQQISNFTPPIFCLFLPQSDLSGLYTSCSGLSANTSALISVAPSPALTRLSRNISGFLSCLRRALQ
jgi:Kef-type K+ transport system membrane component KefB